MERLADYIQGARVERELRWYAPHVLTEVTSDLEMPLNAPFERAVARSLANGNIAGFRPSEVLMPRMMQRFGLAADECQGEASGRAWAATCERCPKVGQCWQHLRGGSDGQEGASFCPNAEAFERRARASA